MRPISRDGFSFASKRSSDKARGRHDDCLPPFIPSQLRRPHQPRAPLWRRMCVAAPRPQAVAVRIHAVGRSLASRAGWNHPTRFPRQLPLGRSRLFSEHPQVAGIVCRGSCRNSQLQTAYEAHGKTHHQTVSSIRLGRRPVASCPMGRHRRPVVGITEYPTHRSKPVCGFVVVDHVGGNSAPDLLVISY